MAYLASGNALPYNGVIGTAGERSSRLARRRAASHSPSMPGRRSPPGGGTSARRVSYGSPRTAKEVIDQAIRDNRPWEYLCYGLVLLFALLGASVIITGLVMGNIALAVVGAATSYLLWPALSNARVIRRENLLLRLFEAPLSRASTARGAAEALRDLLVHVFTNRTG